MLYMLVGPVDLLMGMNLIFRKHHAHMMEIPKHKNVHDNKSKNVINNDNKFTILGEMTKIECRMNFLGKQKNGAMLKRS